MTTVLAANGTNKAHSAHAELQQIRDALCGAPELAAKKDIQPIANVISCQTEGEHPYSLPGDDCAAFPNGDGYQLLAIEGMLPGFVKQDPWHAGWSAVMANVSDIAAMGGRASGVVNAYWHHDQTEAVQIMKGIKNACDVFNIKLAGGHTSISMSHQPGLAVAVLGYATHLLSCHHLQVGQCIYMAVDLNGQWYGNNNYWNVLTGKKREQIRSMWGVLPQLAERGLITTAKDISNAGLLGTLLMMLELNQLGAVIDINKIPRPPTQEDFIRWLEAFQSYGFLLTGPVEHAQEVQESFRVCGVTCKPIGSIVKRPTVVFDYYDASLDIWDLAQRPVTGISFAKRR
ncbi:sll0787 family AIR synthase-like protein [Kaarinaea lacus]